MKTTGRRKQQQFNMAGWVQPAVCQASGVPAYCNIALIRFSYPICTAQNTGGKPDTDKQRGVVVGTEKNNQQEEKKRGL